MEGGLNKIRILFVIDGLEFGGGERVFLQLISRLINRYHTFLATDASGTFAKQTKQLGIQLFPVNMRQRFSLKPIWQLVDIIKNNRVNIVHSQGARADYFVRMAGRIAKVPWIICTVAMPVEGFEVGAIPKVIYRAVDLFTGRYVNRFIVVSEFLRNTLIEKRGVPAQIVTKIYNGIEVDHYRPNVAPAILRTQLSILPNAPLIGALGRMVWQKGFRYLLEAAPYILEVFPEAKFLLVGEGPDRPHLEALARELRISESVIFAGFRTDIKDILSAIEILAVPSLLEGFPMITLEAMAMAKPIVATKINGINEQITDNKEGILIPPRNPEALAEAVLRLIKDIELGSALGAAARMKVERCFPVEKMIRETEGVYLSFLAAY